MTPLSCLDRSDPVLANEAFNMIDDLFAFVEPPEVPPVAELPPPDVLADAGVCFAVSTIASPYLPMASTEETQTAITQITAVTDLMMVSFMF